MSKEVENMKKYKALAIMATILSVTASASAAQITPSMVGYGQTWNTSYGDTSTIGTSITGYQYKGNSLQLNHIIFEKYKTSTGKYALAIRLGAYVDGVNKSANLYFADTDTITTVKGSGLATVTDDGNHNYTVSVSEKDVADIARKYDKNTTNIAMDNIRDSENGTITVGVYDSE